MAMHKHPIVVEFDQDGNVDSFLDCMGYYAHFDNVQAILTAAKRYIKKHKNQDEIDRLNNELAYLQELQEIREKRERKNKIKPQKIDNPCHIYLVHDVIRGLHKVGKAKTVSTRFCQLKTSNPGIELICSYRGVESDEKAIHSVLKSFGKHVDGEWFLMDSADIDYFHRYFKPLPF